MESEEEPEDYGEEFSDEDEGEEEDVFEQKSSKKGHKKDKRPSIYADYDEFASLLEQDLYDEKKAKKYQVG